MDNGDSIDAIVIDFSKAFLFNSAWSAAYETCDLGLGFKGSWMGKGVPFGSHSESQSRRSIIRGS